MRQADLWIKKIIIQSPANILSFIRNPRHRIAKPTVLQIHISIPSGMKFYIHFSVEIKIRFLRAATIPFIIYPFSR